MLATGKPACDKGNMGSWLQKGSSLTKSLELFPGWAAAGAPESLSGGGMIAM